MCAVSINTDGFETIINGICTGGAACQSWCCRGTGSQTLRSVLNSDIILTWNPSGKAVRVCHARVSKNIAACNWSGCGVLLLSACADDP